jgi:urease accessory protein
LPDDGGLMVRILGRFVFDIRDIIYSILGIVRKKILNVSFSGIRKI